MSRIDDISEKAERISLTETALFLESLCERQSYKISSAYPTINGIECRLEKGVMCFNYSANEITRKESPVKYQDKQYGYIDPFDLINNQYHLSAIEGAGEFSIHIGKGMSSDGTIRKLQSKQFKSNSIHRAIIPIPEFFKKPSGFIESLPFKIGDVLSPSGGYIRINVQGFEFGIFDYKINDIESLIIECYDSIDSKKFEEYVSTINHCLGFISGDLLRNEIFLLQFTDKTFTTVTGFYYKKLEDSISGMSIIDPELYYDLHKDSNHISYLSTKKFESIINKSCNDLRLLRAIKIITESQNYPLEIRASSLSVALETIKNIIIEENQEKINPFKNRKTASKIIKVFKQVIDLIAETEFNNKKAVANKIEQLNQVGNRDSFLLSFELLKINLSEDDVDCINMRNDFLHGRLPYVNEIELNVEDFRLHHIVLKLHLLTSSLIMKYCGYEGFMLNNIKRIDILHFKKNIPELLFRNV